MNLWKYLPEALLRKLVLRLALPLRHKHRQCIDHGLHSIISHNNTVAHSSWSKVRTCIAIVTCVQRAGFVHKAPRYIILARADRSKNSSSVAWHWLHHCYVPYFLLSVKFRQRHLYPCLSACPSHLAAWSSMLIGFIMATKSGMLKDRDNWRLRCSSQLSTAPLCIFFSENRTL